MFHTTLKIAVAALSIATVPVIAETAYAADMVEAYTPPRHVVATRHYHREPVRVTRVRATALDCGPVIFEYRSAPIYTEVKTLCSGPWTKPVVSEY